MAAHDAVESVPTIAWNRCPSSVECAANASAMPSSFSALSASWVGWVSKGNSFGQWKNLGPRMLAWVIGGASGG